MKRRAFLQSSLAVTGLASLNLRAADSSAAPPVREYYELRQYHLRRGPNQKRFEDYAREAAIPALNRAGIGPVGVFNVMAGPDSPTAWVLIPYPSLDRMVSATAQMRADATYRKDGADFIDTPASDPVYVRMENSLMVAFEGMPRLEVPAATAAKQPRIFELRIYESHSKKANQAKVRMFNEGEIAIFRRTGLAPVFFGETIIGARQPNLTYLLTFENMAARDRNWSTFVADPEWKKLSATPGWTDPEIVSNISNLFLRPAPCSQI